MDILSTFYNYLGLQVTGRIYNLLNMLDLGPTEILIGKKKEKSCITIRFKFKIAEVSQTAYDSTGSSEPPYDLEVLHAH